MAQKIRSFLGKISKNKGAFLLIILLILGAFLYYGYGKAAEETKLTEEELEEIRVYEQALADYDTQMEEVQKALKENKELTTNLQEYVDNSIYMKLDPASIHQVSVSYRIEYAEGADTKNINTSLQTYPKEGGLKESIEQPEELETAYWDDVLSVSINGNILTITLLHYDMEKAKKILSVIKEKYAAKVSEISAVWGDFTLTEVGSAAFQIADVGILNKQNSNRNTLMAYHNTRADYVSKLNGYRTQKENYRVTKKPECMEKQDKRISEVLLKWVVIGLLAGLLVGCIFVYMKEIVLIQDEELLYRDLGLVVLGKAQKGKLNPETERILEDFRLFAESGRGNAVHLQVLADTKDGRDLGDGLISQMKENSIPCSQGQGLLEKAEDLKNAVAAGCGIAVIDRKVISEKELQRFLDVCKRYEIRTPGCILIN